MDNYNVDLDSFDKEGLFEGIKDFSDKIFSWITKIPFKYWLSIVASFFFFFISKTWFSENSSTNVSSLWAEFLDTAWYSIPAEGDYISDDLFFYLDMEVDWFENDWEWWDPWPKELLIISEEIRFCSSVDELIWDYKKRYNCLDWADFYNRFFLDSKIQSEFHDLVLFYQIDSADDLMNVYIYLYLEDFFISKWLDLYWDFSEEDKIHYFSDFKLDNKYKNIFDMDPYWSYLSDFDDLREFYLIFDYTQRLPYLDKRLLDSNNPAFIASALLPSQFVQDKNALNNIYDENLFARSLFLALEKDEKISSVFDGFDVDWPNKFRRLFFPVPDNLENTFMELMVNHYDWSKFDNIETAFSGDEAFMSDVDDSYINMELMLQIFKTPNVAMQWFDKKSQMNAFNKFMQISNIHDINQVDLDVRRRAFMEILYWENVLNTLWVPDEFRAPLSMIALRNDMTEDDAQIVPLYPNIVYVPDVSFFYNAMLDAYIAHNIYGDKAPDVYSLLWVWAHETTLKDIDWDVDYGGSRWPFQVNTYTVHSLQRNSVSKNFFSMIYPSTLNSSNDKFSFEAPKSSWTSWFFALMYFKNYDATSRWWEEKWLRNYNGKLTPELKEKMDPNVYAAKEAYPFVVYNRIDSYREFSAYCDWIANWYEFDYWNLLLECQTSDDPFVPWFYPEMGVWFYSFLEWYFSWRECINLDAEWVNKFFTDQIQLILNPPEWATNLDYSSVEGYTDGEVVYNYSFWLEEQTSITIKFNARDHFMWTDISVIDVPGKIYMKYDIGDPDLENTLFSYLRENLDEWIAFHNNNWQDWDPYYEIVDKWSKKWVKVFNSPWDSRSSDDVWILDKEWIKKNWPLKLYLDKDNPLYRYTLSNHWNNWVSLFVENDINGKKIATSLLSVLDVSDMDEKNIDFWFETDNPNSILFYGASLIEWLNYSNRCVNKISWDINFVDVNDFSLAWPGDVHVWGTRWETIKQWYKKLKNNIESISASGINYIFFSYILNDVKAWIDWEAYFYYAQKIVDLCASYWISVVFFEPFSSPKLQHDLALKVEENAKFLNDVVWAKIISYSDLLWEEVMDDEATFRDDVHFADKDSYINIIDTILDNIILSE